MPPHPPPDERPGILRGPYGLTGHIEPLIGAVSLEDRIRAAIGAPFRYLQTDKEVKNWFGETIIASSRHKRVRWASRSGNAFRNFVFGFGTLRSAKREYKVVHVMVVHQVWAAHDGAPSGATLGELNLVIYNQPYYEPVTANMTSRVLPPGWVAADKKMAMLMTLTGARHDYLSVSGPIVIVIPQAEQPLYRWRDGNPPLYALIDTTIAGLVFRQANGQLEYGGDAESFWVEVDEDYDYFASETY